jgi:hypothetical protein
VLWKQGAELSTMSRGSTETLLIVSLLQQLSHGQAMCSLCPYGLGRCGDKQLGDPHRLAFHLRLQARPDPHAHNMLCYVEQSVHSS